MTVSNIDTHLVIVDRVKREHQATFMFAIQQHSETGVPIRTNVVNVPDLSAHNATPPVYMSIVVCKDTQKQSQYVIAHFIINDALATSVCWHRDDADMLLTRFINWYSSVEVVPSMKLHEMYRLIRDNTTESPEEDFNRHYMRQLDLPIHPKYDHYHAESLTPIQFCHTLEELGLEPYRVITTRLPTGNRVHLYKGGEGKYYYLSPSATNTKKTSIGQFTRIHKRHKFNVYDHYQHSWLLKETDAVISKVIGRRCIPQLRDGTGSLYRLGRLLQLSYDYNQVRNIDGYDYLTSITVEKVKENACTVFIASIQILDLGDYDNYGFHFIGGAVIKYQSNQVGQYFAKQLNFQLMDTFVLNRNVSEDTAAVNHIAHLAKSVGSTIPVEPVAEEIQKALIQLVSKQESTTI